MDDQDQDQEEVGGLDSRGGNDDGGDVDDGGVEVPQQVADLAEASVPNAIRGIRACKRCGILKTLEQFINDGTFTFTIKMFNNNGKKTECLSIEKKKRTTLFY